MRSRLSPVKHLERVTCSISCKVSDFDRLNENFCPVLLLVGGQEEERASFGHWLKKVALQCFGLQSSKSPDCSRGCMIGKVEEDGK